MMAPQRADLHVNVRPKQPPVVYTSTQTLPRADMGAATGTVASRQPTVTYTAVPVLPRADVAAAPVNAAKQAGSGDKGLSLKQHAQQVCCKSSAEE